jgi:HPr kinase/phosphorylase
MAMAEQRKQKGMTSPVTVEQILQAKGKDLDLKIMAGAEGLKKMIASSELNRPGLAFAGFFDVFAPNRIQILGITEISFLKSLGKQERLERLQRTFGFDIPCFIITSDQEPPPEFLEMANSHNVPVMTTTIPTSRFSGMMSRYLEKEFAPSCTIHGDLLDVYGLGVLIAGKSGVGKSECALELIERGHRLVADDVVILRRLTKDLLVGRSSHVLKYHMEIRGLGIVDVESLFGVGSVLEEKSVSLLIRLEKWEEGKEYERLGIEEQHCTIFDVKIPEYVIPIEPGRNLSILIEVAALTQRLKNTGVVPAKRFNERLIQKMRAAADVPTSLARLLEDTEVTEI